MSDKKPSIVVSILAWIMFAFLLAPIVLVVPLSFSNDLIMKFPPDQWGVRWYVALFQDGAMASALGVSLIVGIIVTALSLLCTVPAAYAIVRLKFPGAEALNAILTSPMLLPTIVIALAMLIIFAANGLFGTYHGLVLAHMILAMPISLRVVMTSLLAVPPAAEEAAASLGASPIRVFFTVTLPLIRPGLLAASVLTFLTSFDETVVSLFLSGPRVTTLPVALFHYVERRADPLVACASVFLIVLSFVVVLIAARSVGLSGAFAPGHSPSKKSA